MADENINPKGLIPNLMRKRAEIEKMLRRSIRSQKIRSQKTYAWINPLTCKTCPNFPPIYPC